MVREELKNIGSDERHTFTGSFGGVGLKTERRGRMMVAYSPTILLIDVKLGKKIVTDHLWFNYGKRFADLGEFVEGDIIQFDARIGSYSKGYYTDPQTIDYKLERPTKISLLSSKSTDRKVMPNPLTCSPMLVGYVMKVNKDEYEASGKPYFPWYVERYEQWWKQNKQQ